MTKNKYTIEDFLEVKSSFAPRFSPDGLKIAYLSNATGTLQVYIIPTNGGNPVQLTDFPDPISGLIFSPTDDQIIFSKSEDGNENDQLYLLDPNTKEVTCLTHDKDIKHNLGPFSYDGRLVSYASNERNGKDFDVYIMDLKTRERKCVFSLGGWCSSAGFSPSRKYLTVKRKHSNEHNDVYLCNLESGEVSLLTSREEKVFHGIPRWIPDESAFFITQDKGLEFMSLSKYSMKDKKFKYVLKPNWDISGLSIHRGGKYLSITLNEDGYSKVTISDPNTLKAIPYEFPLGEIYEIIFSEDGKYMAYNLGDYCHAVNVYVMDMATGVSKKLTDSPQGVPPEILVESELIHFISFDELEVPTFIYKPKNIESGKKLPAIINIHGGPESQYKPGLALLTQYFVHAGYVVVAPNVRGSSGYGKTYMALDNVEKRLDSVKDIVALRDYLKNVPEVDIERIVLMGSSYGGFMVLACMAFYPNLWAAGVDIVGIVNFVTFLENTAPYRRALREAEYGSLEKDRKILDSISPINSIDKIKAPLFVIHGANDPRVPLSEAEQVVSKLKEHGRDAELLVYPDEGHGLAKLKNRLDAYPKVIKFLNKELGLN